MWFIGVELKQKPSILKKILDLLLLEYSIVYQESGQCINVPLVKTMVFHPRF